MNTEELGKLFIHHRPGIVRYVHYAYPFIDEDTLDNLYVELWVRLSRQNNIPVASLKSYLIAALKNKVKDHTRDMAASNDVMDRFPIFSLSDPHVIDAVDKYNCDLRLDDEESNERYLAVMSGLPETLRLVAELYYIDGCTQEEIACHLGTYRVRVLRMIRRATQEIRKRYEYYRQARKKGLL